MTSKSPMGGRVVGEQSRCYLSCDFKVANENALLVIMLFVSCS